MTSFNELNAKTVINSILDKGINLNADVLTKIAGREMSSYKLLDLLCMIISAIHCIEHNKDLSEFCDMQLTIDNKTKQYKELSSLYDKLAVNYRNTCIKLTELELKMAGETLEKNTLKGQLEELQHQLEVLRILTPA